MNRVLFKSQSTEWATPRAVYDKLNAEFHFNFDPCPLGGRVNSLAVYLIPARTCTRWFHDLVLPHAKEIRFIRGRLTFGDAKAPAPFPSCVVVFER